MHDIEDMAWEAACERYHTNQPSDEQYGLVYQELVEERQEQVELDYDAWREEQL